MLQKSPFPTIWDVSPNLVNIMGCYLPYQLVCKLTPETLNFFHPRLLLWTLKMAGGDGWSYGGVEKNLQPTYPHQEEDYFKGNPKSLNFYFLVIWWVRGMIVTWRCTDSSGNHPKNTLLETNKIPHQPAVLSRWCSFSILFPVSGIRPIFVGPHVSKSCSSKCIVVRGMKLWTDNPLHNNKLDHSQVLGYRYHLLTLNDAANALRFLWCNMFVSIYFWTCKICGICGMTSLFVHRMMIGHCRKRERSPGCWEIS